MHLRFTKTYTLSHWYPVFLDKGTEMSWDTVGLYLPQETGDTYSKSNWDVHWILGYRHQGVELHHHHSPEKRLLLELGKSDWK